MEILLIISIIFFCISLGISIYLYRLLFIFSKCLTKLQFLLDKSDDEKKSYLRQELIYYFLLSNKPKLFVGHLILALKNRYNFVEIFDELENLKKDGIISYPFPRVRDSDSIIEIHLEKIPEKI